MSKRPLKSSSSSALQTCMASVVWMASSLPSNLRQIKTRFAFLTGLCILCISACMSEGKRHWGPIQYIFTSTSRQNPPILSVIQALLFPIPYSSPMPLPFATTQRHISLPKPRATCFALRKSMSICIACTRLAIPSCSSANESPQLLSWHFKSYVQCIVVPEQIFVSFVDLPTC